MPALPHRSSPTIDRRGPRRALGRIASPAAPDGPARLRQGVRILVLLASLFWLGLGLLVWWLA